MDYQTDPISHTRCVIFNPALPCVMHIDLNSCFASVEQQANPLLRHKPIAIVHSDTPYGCILAPSIEAKLWGVKTGMTLSQGLDLCPWLIARVADPPKYRQIHAQFARLLAQYSPHVIAKSIDEFVLSLPGVSRQQPTRTDLEGVSSDIKSRIKSEIGDYLRVSIGVSTNQVLAKLASDLHKPDGFDIIDQTNYAEIYGRIKLQDFCGINTRNEARLHRVGIFTPLQFYQADLQTLKQAFQSILGRYWYMRLRGYEARLDSLDRVDARRVDDHQKSFGQSYVLPRPLKLHDWRPILAKLIAKASRRLRQAGYCATGVHLDLRYADGSHFKIGRQAQTAISLDSEILSFAMQLFAQHHAPTLPVKKIAITCFGAVKETGQLSWLSHALNQRKLLHALDTLNDRYGEYSVHYGSLIGSQGHVKDAIAFGK